VSAAGGGSEVLPEPEPPQAFNRPRVVSRIIARNEFRIVSRRRGCRCIGFMGLEIPILAYSISRGILL
jgi:hypothetical protein